MRHPKALPFLFLTEMWERFGFYVVQGLLVLYLTQSFGFSDSESYTISGAFTALAYIAPMVGGYLADSFLGFKVAILWGGVFLVLGYALLAFTSMQGFYVGLATIIVGNGLFKPNVSSLLGALYSSRDSGRDTGFTIFYIGINLGILLAGLLSGTIKEHYGWHAGFASASLGLVLALIIFSIGLKWGNMQYQSLHKQKKTKHLFLRKPFLILYCIFSIGILSVLLKTSLLGDWLLPAVGIVLLIFMANLAYRQKPDDRKRLFTLYMLILSSIVFWTIYLQMFFSVNLFIERLINRKILGFTIPTTAFYALEGAFIILLGPLFAWSWQALNHSNRNPSPFIKFIFAIVFVGFAFLLLAMSTYFQNSQQLVNPLWVLFAYLLITIGEMLLSPIGLSAITLLSPSHLTGMMMGIWFVALGFGGEFAGVIAKLSSVSGAEQNALAQLPIYRGAFLSYSCLAFGVAIVLFVTQLFLRKILKDN